MPDRAKLMELAETYKNVAAHLDGVLSKRPCMDFPATFAASTTAKQFEASLRAIAGSIPD